MCAYLFFFIYIYIYIYTYVCVYIYIYSHEFACPEEFLELRFLESYGWVVVVGAMGMGMGGAYSRREKCAKDAFSTSRKNYGCEDGWPVCTKLANRQNDNWKNQSAITRLTGTTTLRSNASTADTPGQQSRMLAYSCLFLESFS